MKKRVNFAECFVNFYKYKHTFLTSARVGETDVCQMPLFA